ncbi:MAG TPA: sigma-70 family RNA polymerase sigma factor [Myxococcales bacterium]|jgi:RNA polymerase sigma-70 factor (ECF subfamily)
MPPNPSSPDGRAPLDPPALEELYRRLEKPLFNAVYRWIWDSAEARDVVQEAFVKLWGMAGRVDLSTVEPLVWRLALNAAAHRRRRRKLWQWLTLEALTDRGAAGKPADEALAEHQREEAVRRAVDELPEKLKSVVTMCEFSGLSYGEIARALKIPEGTVASRRNAALKKLEEKLGPLEDDEPREVAS